MLDLDENCTSAKSKKLKKEKKARKKKKREKKAKREARREKRKKKKSKKEMGNSSNDSDSSNSSDEEEGIKSESLEELSDKAPVVHEDESAPGATKVPRKAARTRGATRTIPRPCTRQRGTAQYRQPTRAATEVTSRDFAGQPAEQLKEPSSATMMRAILLM
ncbi:PREDICTED: UPF0396 protein CG6066-like [Trachymyrmex cornetzi]|uniref:UPF0396 protein CG6066-like n=1 Tax=Trachymyrmex cornetzi TaxID=471704 RepID=UPI00084F1722|nr:PREDICTED: UPF0396 protein CG6066-like [Trachymyrmex cornetzi]